MLTDEVLADLGKLCTQATPGPWFAQWTGGTGYEITRDGGEVVDGRGENAEFIAAARTYLPQLLAEIDAYERNIEDLNDNVMKAYGQVRSLTARLERYDAQAYEDLIKAKDGALAEVERQRAEVAETDRALMQVIPECDERGDAADVLAEAIARLTGVEIGEHSSANDPWRNALDAAGPMLGLPDMAVEAKQLREQRDQVVHECREWRREAELLRAKLVAGHDGCVAEQQAIAMRDEWRSYEQLRGQVKALLSTCDAVERMASGREIVSVAVWAVREIFDGFDPEDVTHGGAPGDAHAAGFAEAVAMLRDENRYTDWWTALKPDDPSYGYWQGPGRRHLADYLETIKRPLPGAVGFELVDEPEHAFDEGSVLNPVTGKPYGPGPLWAGAEPMDYPDPRCVCGELWGENNRCSDDLAARPELPWALRTPEGHTRLRVHVWPSLEAPRTGALTVADGWAEFTVNELEQGIAAMTEAVRRIKAHASGNDSTGARSETSVQPCPDVSPLRSVQCSFSSGHGLVEGVDDKLWDHGNRDRNAWWTGSGPRAGITDQIVLSDADYADALKAGEIHEHPEPSVLPDTTQED